MINARTVGVPVAVGVIDEVLERYSASKGQAGFNCWVNWGRLGMAIVGYGGQLLMPRQTALFETLAIADTPLMVKTLAKQFVKDSGTTGAGALVLRGAAARGAVGRGVRTGLRESEFENVRVF